MEINYVGEHLWAGNLGYFFVVLSFGAAILSLAGYVMSTRTGDRGWLKMGRFGFLLHAIGVFGIILMLFVLINSHWYEFHYVWSHSSNDMPVEYMLACFWEGQEGSFLLWTFWHVLIGILLIAKAKKWESSVMIIVALAQMMLSAMLLGLDLWGDEVKELGMNPFRLLRDELAAPIFGDPNYLASIVDGTGLNPLLQNYWNVIHPPVLFLGFALTIVPFAYAMAGLIRAEMSEWVKPALPWAGVGVGVLGLGILMGGAWAYEALSFGGFWAWDPVENAVLVPWLVLVGGLHTLVIFKNTGKALVPSFLMSMGGFILILYSTFLTRSGVLGDSSVHSFTDLGLSGQLLIFLFMFVLQAIFFMLYRWKHYPKTKSDDEMSSRELWMLVGSLVLVISAFQISFSTSIPVFNAFGNWAAGLLGMEQDFNMAPPVDPVSHYNKFQIPFSIVVALLTAIGQYFKYRKSPSKVWKKILITFLISIPVSAFFILTTNLRGAIHLILLFASIFTIVGNIDMMIPFVKSKKLRFSGASIAHIGLGFILLGALISNARRQVVSINTAGIDYGELYTDQDKVENVLLPKGKAIQMGGYWVTYLTDSFSAPNHYYKVAYQKVNPETGEKEEKFYLYPKCQINPEMGLVSDPSIKRTWTWDLYTHVSSVPSEEDKKEYTDNENFKVKTGDTLKYRDFMMIIGPVNLRPDLPNGVVADTSKVSAATSLPVEFVKDNKVYQLDPIFAIEGNKVRRPAAYSEELGVRMFFVNIFPETHDFEIALATKNDASPEYIIMKAMVFPMINLLWLGCVLLFIGSLVAVYRRVIELKPKK